MTDPLNEFYVHTASVQTYTGTGPRGDTFASAVAVACFVDDEQDVTLQGTTIAVSDLTKVYAPLSAASLFTPASKVTVNGQQARVTAMKRHSSGALGLPDHVEVTIK